MSEQPSRVNPREISDFLAALRSHSDAARSGQPRDPTTVLAWKSSLLDRIAATTDDPETHDVAERARRTLAEARGDTDVNGGER